MTGTEWADADGKKQPYGQIAFDHTAIVSSTPLDDWKPTCEEFEGYTGNAGNTLDRWYHRSAIVVWRRDRHFNVVACSGAANCIPLFGSMAAKLAKSPKKRFQADRTDCVRFARAIITQWPNRTVFSSYDATNSDSPYGEFPEQLLALHDQETITRFLTRISEQDQALRLSALILTACREFGWNAYAPELKLLVTSRPNKYDPHDVPLRDFEWLADFCCDNTADPGKSALARELCTLVVERFCEPRPPNPACYSPLHRRRSSVSETALPFLLKALLASGCDETVSRIIDFVQQSPAEFDMDACQVPCLQSLIPWSRKRFGSVPTQLASWLASVRHKLETATAEKPAPPADWARPAKVSCTCHYCAKLNAFLADPANEVGRIPANERMRQHMIGMISRHQCDVKHTLERTGSPYSLVLTKTNGSFDRAVKRFETDLRLLSELPPSV